MQGNADPTLLARPFPVAAGGELVRHSVFQTELLGEELALWRADDGRVNLWENRCPHRGLRLTLGHNLGQELRCQYHGLRYASGSGRCTAIPAHPGLTPPKGICVKSYVCCEKYGFVWASLAGDSAVPRLPTLDSASILTLRSLPFNVSADRLVDTLRGYELPPIPRSGDAAPPGAILHEVDNFTLQAVAKAGACWDRLFLLLQPLRRDRVILHGLFVATGDAQARLRILRHYSDLFTELRRRIEADEPVLPPTETPAMEQNSARALQGPATPPAWPTDRWPRR